jgi:hypothetical protein
VNSTCDTADMVSRDEYSDSFSSLPRGRCLGSVPFDASEWHPTCDQERAVEAYLASKSGEEQLALARLMRDVELGPRPRQGRSTDNIQMLQQPGAGRVLAQQWWAELAGGRL